MSKSAIDQPLAEFLKTYCNVDAPKALNDLKTYVANPPTEEGARRVDQFRSQLAAAIVSNNVTPKQYELLTGEDFDSLSDLKEWLNQLWRELFGDQSPRKYMRSNHK